MQPDKMQEGKVQPDKVQPDKVQPDKVQETPRPDRSVNLSSSADAFSVEASGAGTGRSLFLILLACTGNVSLSAQSAGLSRQLVCHWRKTDRLFAAGWDSATAQFADQLRYAAFQRGVEGRREPIFYQGEKIGERVQYSDPLLLYLLQLSDADTASQFTEEGKASRDQLLAQIAAQMAVLGTEPENSPDKTTATNTNKTTDTGANTDTGTNTDPDSGTTTDPDPTGFA